MKISNTNIFQKYPNGNLLNSRMGVYVESISQMDVCQKWSENASDSTKNICELIRQDAGWDDVESPSAMPTAGKRRTGIPLNGLSWEVRKGDGLYQQSGRDRIGLNRDEMRHNTKGTRIDAVI
jgi:hypothetical protein